MCGRSTAPPWVVPVDIARITGSGDKIQTSGWAVVGGFHAAAAEISLAAARGVVTFSAADETPYKKEAMHSERCGSSPQHPPCE